MLELALTLGEPLVFRDPDGKLIGQVTVCHKDGGGVRALIDLPKNIRVYRKSVDLRMQQETSKKGPANADQKAAS